MHFRSRVIFKARHSQVLRTFYERWAEISHPLNLRSEAGTHRTACLFASARLFVPDIAADSSRTFSLTNSHMVGHVTLLSGYCPMTDRYNKPCWPPFLPPPPPPPQHHHHHYTHTLTLYPLPPPPNTTTTIQHRCSLSSPLHPLGPPSSPPPPPPPPPQQHHHHHHYIHTIVLYPLLPPPTTTPCRGGQVYNLDLINPELRKKKKKYTNSGTLNFVSVK